MNSFGVQPIRVRSVMNVKLAEKVTVPETLEIETSCGVPASG
jgi:hypothetical protein